MSDPRPHDASASVTGGSAEGSAGGSDEHDGLLSRLRVIEDQPLETRAEAFGQVYAELRAELDGSDQPAR